MSTQVLVITGDGINCERETARAFTQEGGTARILHVNEFLEKPAVLLEHSVFCIPGGFSFGDELRSGKILAEKMRNSLAEIFAQYTKQGGLTLGVCNGFQVLIQLGVFGELETSERSATLVTNDHGKFWDQWTTVEITDAAQNSPWFSEMKGTLALPIRHKEGRILPKNESAAKNLRIPLRYTQAVNGSYHQAAALLDSTGQILGLMPHPEAATHGFLNPLHLSPFPLSASSIGDASDSEQNAALVRKLFQNALAWKEKKK